MVCGRTGRCTDRTPRRHPPADSIPSARLQACRLRQALRIPPWDRPCGAGAAPYPHCRALHRCAPRRRALTAPTPRHPPTPPPRSCRNAANRQDDPGRAGRLAVRSRFTQTRMRPTQSNSHTAITRRSILHPDCGVVDRAHATAPPDGRPETGAIEDPTDCFVCSGPYPFGCHDFDATCVIGSSEDGIVTVCATPPACAAHHWVLRQPSSFWPVQIPPVGSHVPFHEPPYKKYRVGIQV